METQPILPRSEIFYVVKTGFKTFLFRKVYRTMQGAPLIVTDYGSYIAGNFQKTINLSALEERRNLHGTHFRGGLVINFAESVQNYQNYR